MLSDSVVIQLMIPTSERVPVLLKKLIDFPLPPERVRDTRRRHVPLMLEKRRTVRVWLLFGLDAIANNNKSTNMDSLAAYQLRITSG